MYFENVLQSHVFFTLPNSALNVVLYLMHAKNYAACNFNITLLQPNMAKLTEECIMNTRLKEVGLYKPIMNFK